MKTFTPYAEGSGFTQLDNSLIDYVMPSVNPSDWVIICFVVRKTRGWHKDSDALSLTQMEAGTGLSRPTVVSSLKRLTEQGHLSRVDGVGTISNRYGLNPDFVISTDEGEGLKNLTSKKTLPVSSKESLPLSSKKTLHTKETPKQTKKESVAHAPATADDLMPAHLRGWIENNQPATGELLDTDQALAQLEANAPYKAAIIQASRDKRETGRNSAPLREAAQRARELGFMPEQILAAFSMADGSYWRSTSFGRNGERPYVSNICQMIDEAASNSGLVGDAAKALEYLISYQETKRADGWVNGAGNLARAAGQHLGGVQAVMVASKAELVQAVKAVAQ